MHSGSCCCVPSLSRWKGGKMGRFTIKPAYRELMGHELPSTSPWTTIWKLPVSQRGIGYWTVDHIKMPPLVITGNDHQRGRSKLMLMEQFTLGLRRRPLEEFVVLLRGSGFLALTGALGIQRRESDSLEAVQQILNSDSLTVSNGLTVAIREMLHRG
ncbi:hypothetical protein V6N12_020607 [Hibiscus sabdariffa]|uniref:Uncharacterized protein n=1 Tax=Hibiscus sabdariffa TaxID=183260 RepID=A0ABR2CZE4_9ROSI